MWVEKKRSWIGTVALGGFALPHIWTRTLSVTGISVVVTILYEMVPQLHYSLTATPFSLIGFALGIYLLQLAANALWSWLFFGWRLGNAAAIEVVVLLLLIVVTVVAFWRVRPLAGALLLPYLAWVSYATALTISIVRRNPQLL